MRYALKLGAPEISAGEVKSWGDFSRTIGRFRRIGKLVLFLHGPEDGDGLAINEHLLMMDQIIENLRKGGAAPLVRAEVSVEACRAGVKPVELAALGEYFHAPRILGWNLDSNYSLVTGEPKPGEMSATQMRGFINKVQSEIARYVLPGFDLTPQNITRELGVPINWFSDDARWEKFPDWPRESVSPERFQARSSWEAKPLRGDDTAALVALQEKYATPVRKKLEQVVIEFSHRE